MSDETTAPTTSEQPKHYSPGTIKKTTPMEGDAPPAQEQDAPKDAPPPSPAMKPNEAIQMPPGSVDAPSSFPGGAPPTDVIQTKAKAPAGDTLPADGEQE